MKVICSRDHLMEGIGIVQKAVSAKTTLPILEGILLEADERFRLTGNDLELGIEYDVDADVREKGSVVLNSRMFGEVARRLPDSEVLIETKENNTVLIECERTRFELKGLPAEGYPGLPEINRDHSFSISQRILRDMIRQTIFAVGVDENRPILTGSLLEGKNREFTMVSIDNFRLALRKYRVENEIQEFSVVVPGKTLNEIARILQPTDDEINVYNSSNQILFDLGKCRIVSRLLEGKYMNYQGLIRRERETVITVRTKEFLSGVDRASLVISSDDRRYPVRITLKDDKMIINSSTEMGTVREEIGIEMEGKEIEIGFNPRYLMDALKAIDEEKTRILLTTNVSCTIMPPDGEDYTYLVGAVRI